jgi:hypothetical protein
MMMVHGGNFIPLKAVSPPAIKGLVHRDNPCLELIDALYIIFIAASRTWDPELQMPGKIWKTQNWPPNFSA